ncbi:hypothetical protein, partial [Paenibacillus xylanexedens]|uniref:hypothetical protein n=1 Tax=Paenibacillus xylanexedens TaxID=528191 RepID=UPI0016435F40
EISVEEDCRVRVGESEEMIGKVKRKKYGERDFNEGMDVWGREGEMKWFWCEERMGRIEVKRGMLKGESGGRVSVGGMWKNGRYVMWDRGSISVR